MRLWLWERDLFFRSLLIFSIFLISANGFTRELYSYDKSISIFENEQRFLSNLKRHCKDYGLKQNNDLLTPAESLETYPKDIAFYFFKKNIRQICYYGVSLSFKYLWGHLQQDTEALAIGYVRNCLSPKPTYTSCSEVNKTSTLFDLTVILGHFCSTDTLKLFKQINCRYKTIKDQECKRFIDQGKPIQECPYYYSGKVETKQLHKNYFQKTCKLKWRAPDCIY